MKQKSPKILLFDLETSPIEAYIWSIQGPQFVALNQIKEDWSILSFCAKFLDEDKVYYFDTRNEKNPRNDKALVKKLHELMSQADIIIGQNSDKFDIKKAKARFIYYKLKPLQKHKTFDTLKHGRKHFGFTSHKLEYMTHHLGLKNKKLKDREFVGMDLWKECLNGNIKAWKEMELYNKLDVLSLEDLYKAMAPFGNTIDYNLYNDDTRPTCNCGSHRLQKRGFNVSASGRFQRFQCLDCGAWMSQKGKDNNKLSLEKRKNLLKKD